MATCARAHVDEVDAFLIAQLAGWERKFAERNLCDEAWLEGIADIESSANSLPGARRIRQFILFVGDVAQRVFWVCLRAMCFAPLAKKITDDLAAAWRGRAIDDRNLARRRSAGAAVVHAGE